MMQEPKKEIQTISESEIDESLIESFPASDPSSWTLALSKAEEDKTDLLWPNSTLLD